MGTMDSAAATALHQAGDVLSFQLIQAMSDTLPHDPHYEGQGFTSSSGFVPSTRERRKSNDGAFWPRSSKRTACGPKPTTPV